MRQRGYATSDREEYDNICGIAALIFDYVAEVIASINVWGTMQEMDMPALEVQASDLLTVTQEITGLIGSKTPA